MIGADYQTFMAFILNLLEGFQKCFFIIRPSLVIAGTLDGNLYIFNSENPTVYHYIRYSMRNTIDNESTLEFLKRRMSDIVNGSEEEFIEDYEKYILSNEREKDTHYQIPTAYFVD